MVTLLQWNPIISNHMGHDGRQFVFLEVEIVIILSSCKWKGEEMELIKKRLKCRLLCFHWKHISHIVPVFLSFGILNFWSKIQKYRKYDGAILWYSSALARRVLNQEICEGKHQIYCQNKTSMEIILTRLHSWLQTIHDSDPNVDDSDKWECVD